MKIKSHNDLLKIKSIYNQSIQSIEIDLKNFKKNNLFRHALKYSFHYLKIGGKIKITDSSFLKNMKKNNFTWWISRKEIFKTLENQIKCLELDRDRIVFEKIDDKKYISNGISVGIVFSGNINEEESLIQCLNAIHESSKKLSQNNIEVIISGPSSYDCSKVMNLFDLLKIKYLICDDIVVNKRILICKKKNLIFENSHYSSVVIMHTRINLAEDFLMNLLNKKFDIISPKVFFRKENRDFDYLSIQFVKNYFTFFYSAFTPDQFNGSYLKLFKNNLPYIDGGIVIINKNLFENFLPFNDHLAWEEAEDVEMSSMAYARGMLVDFHEDLKCFSQTEKYNTKKNFFQKFSNFFLKFLRI